MALHPAGSPSLETLEPRQLLSGISFVHGVWHIVTPFGAADDTVVIQADPNDATMAQAVINGQVADERSITDILRIQVSTGRGNDTIEINLDSPIRCELYGGAGDDIIHGGAGNDLIVGGGGSDKLYGSGGDDLLLGGNGNDTLQGNTGHNRLYGQRGHNVLSTNADDRFRRGKHDCVYNGGQAVTLETSPDGAAIGQWLIDRAVAQYANLFGQESFWYRWPPIYLGANNGIGVLTNFDTAGASQVLGSSTDHSTTNTQVAGVDESDLIKTDGNFLYVLTGQDLLIVDATDPTNLHEESRLHLDGTVEALYLLDHRLVVAYQEATPYYVMSGQVEMAEGFAPIRGDFGQPQFTMEVFDTADPAALQSVEKTTITGYLQDSRVVDDRVYLVVNNSVLLPPPQLVAVANDSGGTDDGSGDGTGDNTGDDGQTAPPSLTIWRGHIYPITPGTHYVYETEQAYRDRMAGQIDQYLPAWNTFAADGTTVTEAGVVLDPADMLIPADSQESNVSSVLLMNLDDGHAGVDSTASALGAGGTIYASQDSLYMVWQDWAGSGGQQSSIAKFNLGADSVSLAATGIVPGAVLNKFAMDEQDGYFRIATTLGFGQSSNNDLFTLAQDGDSLTITGSIIDLGKGERIQSVRFMGDRAYVTTFRQVDPLFVLDLSDPTSPTLAGELQMTGYSAYMQAIDQDHVIGLGYEADASGRVLNMQLSLFDVSDPASPTLVDRYQFDTSGWWQSSEATYDAHAFSWFDAEGVLALPISSSSYGHWGQDLQVFHVDPETGFNLLGTVEHSTSLSRVCGTGVQQPSMRRSLMIGQTLFAISDQQITAHKIGDGLTQIGFLRYASGILEPWIIF